VFIVPLSSYYKKDRAVRQEEKPSSGNNFSFCLIVLSRSEGRKCLNFIPLSAGTTVLIEQFRTSIQKAIKLLKILDQNDRLNTDIRKRCVQALRKLISFLSSCDAKPEAAPLI
jgi:hypothetical protein